MCTMAQRCVPRHRYGVCLTVHTQPAGNRCKESLQVRLLRRLRGHRIDLPPVDNHRVVARMEAQGAAQVGKADEYGTEAASALRLRPEARDAVRQRELQRLAVIAKMRCKFAC